MEFSYVYILQSQLCSERFYVGLADDLRDRLRRHNGGEVSYTSKFRPWRIKTAVAFSDQVRAAVSKRYSNDPPVPRTGKKRLPQQVFIRAQRERRLPRRSLL